MLEASPLPASPLAAGYAVSIWAGQELWGTWWLVRAAGSAAAQPVTCSSPLKAGKCSVETTPPPAPPTPSNPWPLHPREARCFPSLLSHLQLPFLFFFHPAGRDIFWFLAPFAWDRSSHVPALYGNSWQKRILFLSNPLPFFSVSATWLCRLWSCAFPQSCQLNQAIRRRMWMRATWDLVTAPCPCCWFAGSLDKLASVLTLSAHKMGHPAHSASK